MIGRRVVVGLSLLSALVFCAFAAQSASAALTTSKNTTAVTCVPEPNKKGDFEDEHCDKTHPTKEGAFTHKAIPNGTVTKIHLTNEKVTNETKDSEPVKLTLTLALVKTEIECSTVTGDPEGTTLENSEPEAGKHTVKGAALITFSSCKVNKPAKCTVAEPIALEGTIHGVEGMEGPKAEPNAMGLEFIGKGEKERFGSISFKGAECSLKEKAFSLEGKLIITSGPTTESEQERKHHGATWVFTPKFKMQELKCGGIAAELHMILTPRMAEVTPEKTEPPISITTTP